MCLTFDHVRDEDKMDQLYLDTIEDAALDEQRNDLISEMRHELLTAVKSDLSRSERRSFQRPIKRGVRTRSRSHQGGKKRAPTRSDSSSLPSSSNRSAVTPFALNGVLLGGV